MYNLSVLDGEKIFYYTDVITRPDKLLEFIEQMDSDQSVYKSISPWTDWHSSSNPLDIFGKSKNIQNYYETGNKKTDREVLYIINSFKSAALYCASNYAVNLKIPKISLTNTFFLQKYNPGSKMGPHTDAQDENSQFAYSIVMYLNDNHEGGEISFPKQNIKLKPQAGSMLIFPSNEPYVHEAHEVLSGNKYIATTMWYK